ncbi:hypothetical protein V8E55_004017 [Tylopilus felleus]
MPTPWSSSGSLVSDRIRPNPPLPKQQQQNKGKSKGKAPTPEPLKSKAVRALEARLDGARGSNGRAKDPKGGCFCQARNHALSSYISTCRQCGLILCTLNPPYYGCPHCTSPLLDEREMEALVGRLEGELAEQLGKEEAERQKAIGEARAAQGAFPMLPGSQIAKTSRTPPPPTTTRAVLSLNSQTKKVTVSSYSTPTPSRPASREEDREAEGLVPGPLTEASYYVMESVDPGRPWRNVRSGDVKYVPLPGGTSNKPGRKKKGGGRGAAGAL